MRRCPKCNQYYEDEWLTFCTQDGTSLLDVDPSTAEPPPTLIKSDMPPSVSPTEQPTLDMPDRVTSPPPFTPPPPPFAPPPSSVQYIPPQPLQSGWAPPPPPPYPTRPQQSLAVASLILGLVSVTLGLCCYFGILTAPVGLVMGIVAIVQNKNEPQKYGGKGMAIAGIVTSALYFVVLVVIVLLYGLGFLMSGMQ
ncbi:MAG TPA: DUF4190 domain-containing protein [Pyrinomonadaceae bacterium]|nr:DUF4190 domain-containing protein [Pyrinomonadaceae bacterium]